MMISQQASVPDGPGRHNRDRLVAVVGATATGKTAAAVYLGQRFNGEIISADSRLVYTGMTIGTAKPTRAERAAVPHHLIDIRAPDSDFSLAEYTDLARTTISAVQARGRLPLLVGGTAQYVYAVLEGWQVPNVAPQPELRTRLEALGGPELYRRVAEVDPEAAAKIDPRNLRRLVRALEVWEVTGRTLTSWQTKRSPGFQDLRLGLRLPREILHQRIAARVDAMLTAGLVAEVEGLLVAGYRAETTPALNSIGYAEIIRFLRGEWSLATAREQIIFNTNRLVRHQETWFRRDPKIIWVDAAEPEQALKELESLVAAFVAS